MHKYITCAQVFEETKKIHKMPYYMLTLYMKQEKNIFILLRKVIIIYKKNQSDKTTHEHGNSEH